MRHGSRDHKGERKAERRRERGVRINPKRNPGVLSSVGLADIMKIERHDIEETTIEAFADKNGLVMEVLERKKPVGDPSRYLAHFKSAEVREGTHCLEGLFANGRTPEEAIAEYASAISLRTLIIDARTKEQREIEVPRLSANTTEQARCKASPGSAGSALNGGDK